jgi:hypothetical protein
LDLSFLTQCWHNLVRNCHLVYANNWKLLSWGGGGIDSPKGDLHNSIRLFKLLLNLQNSMHMMFGIERLHRLGTYPLRRQFQPNSWMSKMWKRENYLNVFKPHEN